MDATVVSFSTAIRKIINIEIGSVLLSFLRGADDAGATCEAEVPAEEVAAAEVPVVAVVVGGVKSSSAPKCALPSGLRFFFYKRKKLHVQKRERERKSCQFCIVLLEDDRLRARGRDSNPVRWEWLQRQRRDSKAARTGSKFRPLNRKQN